LTAHIVLTFIKIIFSKTFFVGKSPNIIHLFLQRGGFSSFYGCYLIRNNFFQKLFDEVNEPNGVESNICFTKWVLLNLLRLLPWLKTIELLKLFDEGNEPNGVELSIFLGQSGGFSSF
jgi:hypothetical protein